VRERVCVLICEGQREIVVLPSFSNYARVNLGAMKQKEKVFGGAVSESTQIDTFKHLRSFQNTGQHF
jgi:hypothetical protein